MVHTLAKSESGSEALPAPGRVGPELVAMINSQVDEAKATDCYSWEERRGFRQRFSNHSVAEIGEVGPVEGLESL
jgi:hypothetical protein